MKEKLFYSKKALCCLATAAFIIFSANVFGQNEFITTWKTDNLGTSNDTSITIPTTGTGYNYDVDWDNDGTFDEFGLTGTVTHDFTSAGTYTIRIQGTFPRIYFGNGGDKQKIISIDQWGTIAWTSMERAFYGASNLIGNATDTPDLSGVTNMSRMFQNATLFDQDIGSWNTATVIIMDNLFSRASMFNNGGQPLTWDTSSVMNMAGMFYFASAFNNGGQVLSWNTTLVTNMANMFAYATIFNQDISSWDVSKVTNYYGMFNNALGFNNGGQPLNWNLTGVTNLSDMFNSATTFNQDISSWDISNVTTFNNMFYGTAFNNGGVPLNWNLNGVTNTSNMFYGANAFSQDIGSWDMSTVTNVSNMFGNNSSFNQDLSDWNISNVTNFFEMFYNATAYNNGGVQLTWNITGLTNLSGLFQGATAFNQDVSAWDTSLVTDMSSLFRLTDAFNQDLSGWDISKVTSFAYMFDQTKAYNNGGQPLNWNTTGLTNFLGLFGGAIAFNQDISAWNVESVSNFTNMFYGATTYNNGGQPLNWNTPAATNMYNMFGSATVFNQDISTWNTSGVTSMRSMFKNATSFDQDLGGWNVESVTDFVWILDGATLSNANYDALLIGWDAQNLSQNETFYGGNSQYCSVAAQTARTNMMNTVGSGGDGWTITDGGLFGGACSLGIEENELDSSILLYPNPTNENVKIESENFLESILVYDISGRIIFKTLVIENLKEKNISLSGISSGLYFINVKSNKGQSTKKIVKH